MMPKSSVLKIDEAAEINAIGVTCNNCGYGSCGKITGSGKPCPAKGQTCNKCNKMYLMCNGTDITVKSEELKEWKFPSLEEMDEYTRSKYKKANANCARSSLNLQDGV
jgi:hypothetical protein